MIRLDSILLIEDDKITNYINERLIERLDVTLSIETALNGLDAIKMLLSKKEKGLPMPNLILLDINMPVMDGFEFLQKYHALELDKNKDTVIIMLTTSTHVRDMDKLMTSGNIDVLNKPLTREKILQVMNNYFSNQEITSV